MNTLTLLIILITVFFVIFFLNINVFLKKDESLEIWLKIGRFFKFRIRIPKLLKNVSKMVKVSDINSILKESKSMKLILKFMNIEKFTIIENTNVLLDTWNIQTCFLFKIMNIYITNLLYNYFNKVNNVYYSVSYNTIGSTNLKFEITLSIRIYKIIKYLFVRRKLNEHTT